MFVYPSNKGAENWVNHDLKQGIVDGSASKSVLVQDTKYMVEKTYYIAPYLGTFGDYLMPQWPIYGSKGVSRYQNDRWKVAVNSRYFSSAQTDF